MSSMRGVLNSQNTLRLMIAGISLLMMSYVLFDSRLHVDVRQVHQRLLSCPAMEQTNCPTPIKQPEEDIYAISRYVNGPPSASVFDTLRNDTKYVTTFLNAGWTNDMMTIVNSIYLGMLSDRVPILPPHSPVHVGVEADDFLFSDIFDVPRLARTIKHPIIEWNDVKDVKNGNKQDFLGCWTTRKNHEGSPRQSRLKYSLHLDISFSTVPDGTKLLNGHNSFWGLAKLGFPDGFNEALGQTETIPSPQHQRIIKPTEQLMCFDTVYYVAAYDPFEWERDYSPAWRSVGRHLHFHPRMMELAREYLRVAFDLQEDETIPAFIAIHMRRGDFAWECGDNKNTCFPPVKVVAQYVEKMQQALLETRGLVVTRVLMTSDESEQWYWDEVVARGWHYVDHKREQTVEKLGRWYPSFIDGIHQSMGVGFIGTEGSTMSLVALRRTVDWNHGMGVMVPFHKDMYKDV